MFEADDERSDSGGAVDAPMFGGLVPGSGAEAAFELREKAQSDSPVVIAVPHAGRAYPSALLGAMRGGEATALRLEDRLADHLGRAVAVRTGASLLVARAPRAIIDLNRAPEDFDWDMIDRAERPSPVSLLPSQRVRGGLGLVPRRLSGLGEIWSERMTRRDLDARLQGVHVPYHAALSGVLERQRRRWGTALLIDLHSMPPLPRVAGAAGATFVIGDRFGRSCAGRLSAAALRELARGGAMAAHNRPYAGGYVLDRHGVPGAGVHALQVEVDRAAYLDSALREPGEGMAQVVEQLVALVRHLAEMLVDKPASRRDHGPWLDAAE
ncbi:N-formylglutamate amidohydrolase [Novosphingobium sp. 9]|uniref:N-formylglutamate amidohydrolase n=1 Tax=Novosphingobium sp. 9 TaxID=2025349 RepID=UPI0021B5C102|nr:N-formylglutamate amidohydrolase [Novosphingobium sp. 9]